MAEQDRYGTTPLTSWVAIRHVMSPVVVSGRCDYVLRARDYGDKVIPPTPKFHAQMSCENKRVLAAVCAVCTVRDSQTQSFDLMQ